MTTNPSTNELSKEELAALMEALTEQETAYEANKLSLYRPHPMQERYHQSDKKIRVIIGGNRIGKTTCVALEAIQMATGLHPYHQITTPNRIKMYGVSYAALSESLVMKFKEWVPESLLSKKKPYSRNQLSQIIGVNFNNGSTITFGTYDQESMKAESSNWHMVFFDEPPPRDIYIANMRGLIDYGGRMSFAMTPLREPWIYDEIYQPGLTKEKPYIDVFEGSTYDNPYLSKSSIDLFKSELTEDEIEVRIHGKFRKLKGLVIDTYEPSHSDIEPFELDHNYVIYEGIDPHSRKPNAALWKAIDKDGFRYVIEELYFDGGIYDFGCEIAKVRKRLSQHGSYVARSVSDTSLNQKDMMFKINQRDELNRALRDSGEKLFPALAQKKDWLHPGIQKLRDLFRVVEHKDFEEKLPMQFIFKGKVSRYKWELLHYQWPENLLDQTKPIDRNNDLLDCDRYVESIAPEYIPKGQTSFTRSDRGAYQRLKTYERYANG